MKTLNILVTAVGGDLGQSVIKCLKDSDYDTHIVGCDMNPYAGGRADVDAFFQAPPVKENRKYTDFLLTTIEKQKINYVFPATDVEILFFNGNRELFASCPAVFVVNEKHMIDTFMDKYRTVEFFKANGLPYPRTWLPAGYSGQSEFPLILKKRWGSGGQNLLKVKDAEELQFYLKRHSDMIIQEYLPGKDNEYTAGIFSAGKTVYTITFKRSLAPGGFSQQVELVIDESITRFPRQVAEVLNFTGSINVQFRVTDRGCIPFEINPRLSSTVYFRHWFGFKDVQWWLDILQGKSVSYSPIYTRGTGVKKFSEAIFDME
jgi:carbamoyl-phosphate synthase large subunit